MQKFSIASALGAFLMGWAVPGLLHGAPADDRTVAVDMTEFRFIPSQITVDRGRITFAVRNSGQMPHVFQVTGEGVEAHIGLPPGAETALEVTLSLPGLYTLICPIPGHPEEGMQGSILVR